MYRAYSHLPRPFFPKRLISLPTHHNSIGIIRFRSPLLTKSITFFFPKDTAMLRFSKYFFY